MNTELVQFAYVDEAGDPEMDTAKPGVSLFYVVCAVLVDDNDNQCLSDEADHIRQHYFGPRGEMKSATVGNKRKRRAKILEDIANTGLQFCAFVADKQEIRRDTGFRFRRSFVKYFHGRLYRRLYRAFASLHVLADQHGHSDFMRSFSRYLADRYQQRLFDHADFIFAPSAQVPLIQVADMIAGSLLRVYSGKDGDEPLQLLSPRAIIIERWPPSSMHPDVLGHMAEAEKHDHLVAEQGVMQAQAFLRENATSEEPEIQTQMDAIRYLLWQYELDSSRYVWTGELLPHLNEGCEEQLSEHTFRLRVIGKLRSAGVIIASSSKGYKIPNTAADIDSFVSLVNSQTVPYLRRLEVAREQLLLASKGAYEIVAAERYPELAECIQGLRNARSEQPAPADADKPRR